MSAILICVSIEEPPASRLEIRMIDVTYRKRLGKYTSLSNNPIHTKWFGGVNRCETTWLEVSVRY